MGILESASAPKPLAEIKREIHGLDNDEQLASELQDPRLSETYTFDLSYTDKRGALWQGRFTNHILTIEDHLKVGFTQSLLTGRIPIASLPADTAETARRISHLMLSLSDTNRPDWSKDLGKLRDVNLIDALYKEVEDHESIFHGDKTP